MKKMHIKLAFFAVFSALSSLGKSAVLLGKVPVFWYNGNIRNRRKKRAAKNATFGSGERDREENTLPDADPRKMPKP